VDTSNAGPNSNRWIFDVEHDAKDVQAFEFQLLDHRTETPKPSGFVSHSLTPLNAQAAAACLRITQPDLPVLRVELDAVEGPVKYRIAIDVAHSLMR